MSKQKHIAIKASKKSISSMILSILMLLSVIPLHSSTIFAESTKKTVMNGTGNIQKTDSIWFGIRGKDLTGAGSEIQWRVLDTNTNIGEDGIFLLSEKLIGKSDFSKGWKASRKWQGSDAQKWCKDFSGENGDNSLKSLSDQELAAIKPTTESNPGKIAPDVPFHPKEKYALKEDKVFFPSVGEAGKYFQTDDERIAYDGNNPEKWWLRSPHKSLIQNVRIVKQNGGISYSNVKSKLATRPAFNLDTTKVLFTSPAVDGKQSNVAGDALKAVEDTDTTEWKLTLIDRNRTFQLDTDNGEKVTIAGNILTIPYKDATTGTNEYISAVVEKNGSITYYGRLKAVENSNTDKNGEVTVQLPADFDKTTDTLYLINEQLNGDKKTDYSSEKVEVKIPTKHKITVIDGTTDKITAAEGEQVKVTAFQKKGDQVFDKWETTGITLTEEEEKMSPLVFTMPDNDVKFIATFKDNPAQPQEYTVAIKVNNNEMGTVSKDKVENIPADKEISADGNKLTINGEEVTATANPNYKFVKWEGIPAGGKVTGNITVTAHFEQDQQQPPINNFTVAIKVNNNEMGTVSKDKVENIPADKEISADGNKLTINGEEVTATANPNYKFVKWEGIPAGGKVTGNITVTAIFDNPQQQPQEYTVTIKSNNKAMGKVAPDKVEHVAKDTVIDENGNKLTINGKEVIATAENGYKFKNWTGFPQGKKVVANVEITAIFVDPSQASEGHEIIISTEGNGTASSTPNGKVKKDTVVTLKATPNSGKGYKFVKWQVESGNVQLAKPTDATTTFKMPDEDVKVKAIFEQTQQPPQPQPTKYKIKLTDDGNGTATASPSQAEQGKEVTITATAKNGYTFDEWKGTDNLTFTTGDKNSAVAKFTMPNKDVEIKAYFKKKSSGGNSHDTEYYNITTKTDRHGTVEARSKAREGTEVSVTVDPDKGYKLDEITVTDRRGRDIKIKETNRENRYKFTMPARDVTVEATFKQIKQEQPSKPTTPPTIPPTSNNKPTENNIIKKQQTTVFTIGSNIMTVITDGKATQTTIDAKPFLSQGRVMIPVRYAAESLGMQVEWNKQTQTVVLKDRENTVMIPIKTNKIIVGNQEYTSDVTPILKNGRTYLTISNIAKALRMRAGQDVKWDNKIKQVTIIKEVEVR